MGHNTQSPSNDENHPMHSSYIFRIFINHLNFHFEITKFQNFRNELDLDANDSTIRVQPQTYPLCEC